MPTDVPPREATTTTAGGGATLPRVLGLTSAYCVVVGSVIGSGIFMVPSAVARDVPSIVPIVLVWIIGGIFSTFGALTLAELGAMLPQAGGPYVYLREAYGRLPAFLFGWSEFLINRTGSMATLATAFAAHYALVSSPPSGIRAEVWQAGAAIAAIATVTIVNVLGTAWGGKLQVLGTALKVGGVLSLIVLPFVVGGGSVSNLSPLWPKSVDASLVSGMMAAMVGVLWAYDGWMNLTPVAEEVREPGRNIPRALTLGMATLVALYLGATLAYHYVLPIETIQAVKGGEGLTVAATYCKALIGYRGSYAIAALVMCSTFISLNGNALTGPRSYFAMARDGVFPAGIARIHSRFGTPANAVLAQGLWAIGLIVLGTVMILWPAPGPESGLPDAVRRAWLKLNETPLYRILYNYVVFGANVFYLLAIMSVFVLRAKRPDMPRPYRTWGYPFTPLIFVTASLYLLWNMLQRERAESLSGLLIILTGVPAYLFFSRSSARKPAVEMKE
jgi:basic amino acid/polyamine antiporter, APA family